MKSGKLPKEIIGLWLPFNPTIIYDLSELDLSMLHRFAASPLWGVGRLSSAFELSLKTDGLLLCSAMPVDGSLGSAPLDAASAMLHTIPYPIPAHKRTLGHSILLYIKITLIEGIGCPYAFELRGPYRGKQFGWERSLDL